MSVGTAPDFAEYSDKQVSTENTAENEIERCSQLRLIRMIKKNERRWMEAVMNFAREDGHEIPEDEQGQRLLGLRIITDYGRIADSHGVSIRPDEPFWKSKEAPDDSR